MCDLFIAYLFCFDFFFLFCIFFFFFFSSRRRHTRSLRDWSSDVCSSDPFTYTVSPSLRTVLPIGESRLTTGGALDFRYFQKFKDQQSTSGSINTELVVGSGRVRPFGTAGLVRSHERGGYDVDRRAYSNASQVKVGASLALTPMTSLTGWVVRESTRFDRQELFDGVSLSEQLD